MADTVRIEGRIIGKGTFPAKEPGKPGRRVVQVISDGVRGLVNLRTVTDMSPEGLKAEIGQEVEIEVAVGEFRGSISYTYWGPQTMGGGVDSFISSLQGGVKNAGNGNGKKSVPPGIGPLESDKSPF